MIEKPYYDVVFVMPGFSFSKNFISCWSATLNYLATNNFSYLYTFNYSPSVSYIRNLMLGCDPTEVQTISKEILNQKINLRPFNDKINANKIIFIDSDILWTIEDFERLYFSEEPVITGIYKFNDQKHVSVKETLFGPFLTSEEILQRADIFPIEASGLGFTAVTLETLQNLEYPWFAVEEKILTLDNGEFAPVHVGEDIYFFQKLIAAGYTPKADPMILLGHEKTNALRIE